MFVVFVLHVYYHVPLHHHAAPDTSPLEQVVPSSLFESYCITVASLDMKSAGLAGVSSEMGLDDGLLVCTLLLLI